MDKNQSNDKLLENKVANDSDEEEVTLTGENIDGDEGNNSFTIVFQ